jgi:hypothetical protein
MTNSILSTDHAEIRFKTRPEFARRAFVRSTSGTVSRPVFGVDFPAAPHVARMPALFAAGGR